MADDRQQEYAIKIDGAGYDRYQIMTMDDPKKAIKEAISEYAHLDFDEQESVMIYVAILTDAGPGHVIWKKKGMRYDE